ncbi:MAG: hypothetical protein KDA87_06370 [Planctomycetales bacterium]|nr:hypothetical protein [Planctomycetales bacterium]
MSDQDRKSHWQFLANLLGAEGKSAPPKAAEAETKPAEAETENSEPDSKAEAPVRPPEAKASATPKPKKTKGNSNWASVAKSLGLKADDSHSEVAVEPSKPAAQDQQPAEPTAPAVEAPSHKAARESVSFSSGSVDEITSIFHSGKPAEKQPDVLNDLFSVDDAKPPEERHVRQVDDVGGDVDFLDDQDETDVYDEEPKRRFSAEEEDDEPSGAKRKRRRRRSGRRRRRSEESPSEESAVSSEELDDVLADVPEHAAEFADSLDEVGDEEDEETARRGRRRRRRSRRRGRTAESARTVDGDQESESPRRERHQRDDELDDADFESDNLRHEGQARDEERESEPKSRRRRRGRRGRDDRDDQQERRPRSRRQAPASDDVDATPSRAAEVDAEDDWDDAEVGKANRQRARINVPTWLDAVSDIVDSNIAQRANRSRQSRGRGRGDSRRTPRRRD